MTMKIRFMCLKHYCDLSGEPMLTSSPSRPELYEFDMSEQDCPDNVDDVMIMEPCAAHWTAVIYNNFTEIGDSDIRLKMADNGKNFIKVEE
jgi:hypothetical protein